jgi:hypothetical protein
MTCSITTICIECRYAECDYAECCVSFIVMLNVFMLSVLMLSVVMLNVCLLSVVIPCWECKYYESHFYLVFKLAALLGCHGHLNSHYPILMKNRMCILSTCIYKTVDKFHEFLRLVIKYYRDNINIAYYNQLKMFTALYAFLDILAVTITYIFSL